MVLRKSLISGIFLVFFLPACGIKPAVTEQPGAAPDTSIASSIAIEQPTLTSVSPTNTPKPTLTSTSVPIPTPSFEVPAPKEGKGTMVGLVLWGKEPAAKVTVRLCGKFDRLNGCQGTQYSEDTSQDGYYVFSNIDPGSYIILIHVSSAIVVYLADGEEPKWEQVKSGQILTVEPRYIYKDNLVVTSPRMDEKVAAQPTLKWDAYPGATYYELTVVSLFVDYSIESVKVETTEYTFDQSLPECSYIWGVEAFDEAGRKVGETRNDDYLASHLSMGFDVKNPEASCHLKLISPKNGAEINGAQGVEFSWEADSRATCYRLHLNNDNGGDMTQEPDGASFKWGFLPKGVYTWHVEACNSANQILAESDYRTLIVR